MSTERTQRARDIAPGTVVDLDHGERLIDGISLTKAVDDGTVDLSYADGSWRTVAADDLVRVRPWP